jgi:protein phosphatase
MSQPPTAPYIPLPASVLWNGPPVVHCFGRTDRGRVRRENEDQFLIAQLTKAMQVFQSSLPQPGRQLGDERGYLFVVADGMGGHQGGEHASALAVETIEQFMLNTFKWFFRLRGEEASILDEFQTALHEADSRVIHEARREPDLHGMGTTLTLAYVQGSDLFVAHAGDSRCYLYRGGELRQLTRDHTLVAEMVRRGTMSPRSAAQHSWRHIILNVVGGPEEGVEAEVLKVGLEPNDVVLLCSDGLTEMLSDERIAAVLAPEEEPRLACERLIVAANEQGGRDNITAIVARFEEQE